MKDLSTYQVHHGLRLLGMRRHFLPAQRYRYRYWHWSLHQSIPGAGSSTLHLQMSLCEQESKTRTHTHTNLHGLGGTGYRTRTRVLPYASCFLCQSPTSDDALHTPHTLLHEITEQHIMHMQVRNLCPCLTRTP